MIELLGDDFSIKVTEDNPIYKTLNRFIGESILVYRREKIQPVKEVVDSKKQDTKNNKTASKKYISLDAELLFNTLNTDFKKWSNIKEENQPLAFRLLKNHLEQVLGGVKGKKSVEVVSENIFKSGELYLVLDEVPSL